MLDLDKTDSINIGGTQCMFTRMLKTQAHFFRNYYEISFVCGFVYNVRCHSQLQNAYAVPNHDSILGILINTIP